MAVFDWLGTPVSSLGGPGAGPGQFNAPLGLDARGDRVWVADSGNGRIQVLGFDGAALTPLANWGTGLLQPVDVAADVTGQLLVADWGDNQVKLLSNTGQLVQRWTGPTDGHAGPFVQPSGLAWLPTGGVLVADSGNGRVVRIGDAREPVTLHLPLTVVSSSP
jgi:DNA-binding beta-propeller fold protein YncE